METSRILVAMLVVCALIVAGIVGIPYLSTRLSQPVWATFKSSVEFVAAALVLGFFLPSFISLPIALTLAIIRHRARVVRYKSLALATPGNVKQESEAS